LRLICGLAACLQETLQSDPEDPAELRQVLLARLDEVGLGEL
jgi:hypothetical protein